MLKNLSTTYDFKSAGTPGEGLSCLRLVVVGLATPNENVFCKSSITHHDFLEKSF